MHVCIKMRLIPLRSNISIPRETWPRQPGHNKQYISSLAEEKITEKESEETKRGDGESAVRQGDGKRCLSPKTSLSKH